TDEAVERGVGVGDLGRDRLVDAAAADVADDPGRDAAVLARVERLLDRGVDVGVDLQPGAREGPGFALVGDPEGGAQRYEQLAAHRGGRLGGVHAADVDAGDRDAVGDLALLAAVVGVGPGCGQHEDPDRDERGYPRLGSDSAHGCSPVLAIASPAQI